MLNCFSSSSILIEIARTTGRAKFIFRKIKSIDINGSFTRMKTETIKIEVNVFKIITKYDTIYPSFLSLIWRFYYSKGHFFCKQKKAVKNSVDNQQNS